MSTMKFTRIFLLLLILNWTALLGQTGNDTLTCYTNSEMQKIALKVLKANELDTLYKVTLKEFDVQNQILYNQEKQITELYNVLDFKDSIIQKCDSIVSYKDKTISNLNNDISVLNKKNKLLKFGIGVSVVVMIVTNLLTLF